MSFHDLRTEVCNQEHCFWLQFLTALNPFWLCCAHSWLLNAFLDLTWHKYISLNESVTEAWVSDESKKMAMLSCACSFYALVTQMMKWTPWANSWWICFDLTCMLSLLHHLHDCGVEIACTWHHCRFLPLVTHPCLSHSNNDINVPCWIKKCIQQLIFFVCVLSSWKG